MPATCFLSTTDGGRSWSSDSCRSELREEPADQICVILRAEHGRDSGFVFTNRCGEYLHRDTLSHFASAFADKAKLGGVRFHDLRHSYASLVLSKGVPMEVVSEKLGRSRSSTTGNIYQHVFREERERHP